MPHEPGVCTTEIEGLLRTWPPDDGKREMSEEEFHDRIYRVCGDAICVFCGLAIFKHPTEKRVFPETSTVKRMCNGMLGKC